MLILRHGSGGRADSASDLLWDFDHGSEGWRAQHDVAPLEWADGVLKTSVTGPDPYLVSAKTPRRGCSPGDVVIVRLKNGTKMTKGRAYFRTSLYPDFAGSGADFRMEPQDQSFRTYKVKVGLHVRWKGTLLQLRLDPGDFRGSGVRPRGDVALDHVHLIKR